MFQFNLMADILIFLTNQKYNLFFTLNYLLDQGSNFDDERNIKLKQFYFQPPPKARYKLTTACNFCKLSLIPLNCAAKRFCSEVNTSV